MSENREKQWEQIQIKAFTAWVNSNLKDDPIENIQKDFSSGVKLIKFLQNVTAKSLGKFVQKPSNKIQMIENIGIARNFISKEIKADVGLIGAEDIYDGNIKLILGLIWTIFRKLRFQTIAGDGGKIEDGLLLWVKKMTDGYKGVNISSFKESFNDGLAFCALVHKYDHSLLDYNSLSQEEKEKNLALAFEAAEKDLGIPQLLDPADLASGNADERAVTLYTSLFLDAFLKKEEEDSHKIKDKLTLLESALAEAENEREELRRRVKSQDERISQLEGDLEKSNQTINDLRAQLEEKDRLMKEQLAEKDRQLRELQAEKDRLLKEKDDEIARWKSKSEELEGRVAELESTLAGLRDELERQRARCGELEQKLKEYEQTIEDLKNQLLHMEKKLRDSQELVKKLQSELNRVETIVAKARAVFNILKINLEQHLEDMYKWRELNAADLEKEQRVFELEKVVASINSKALEDQLDYLNSELQDENKSLLHIIRLKDVTFENKEVEVKSGFLFLKGHGGMTKRYFSLRGNLLFFKKKEADEAWENRIDLKSICGVTRQKAVKDSNGVQFFPLKLVLGEPGAEQGFIQLAAESKGERKSWFIILTSAIVHIRYLKNHEANHGPKDRVDLRVINLCSSDNAPVIAFESRTLTKEALTAISNLLPAHEEVEIVSFAGSSLSSANFSVLAQPLSQLNKLRSLNLSHNALTSVDDLIKIISASDSLTELILTDNKIDAAGANALAKNAKPTLTKIVLTGNPVTSVSENADKFVF